MMSLRCSEGHQDVLKLAKVMANMLITLKIFEVIDLAVTGMKDRFDQPGYETYFILESLLLKAANQSDYNCYSYFFQNYADSPIEVSL